MADQPARWAPVAKASGWLALAACCVAGLVWAQDSPQPGIQPSIYTCIDPQGRRITSDRPIAECMGSGQRELSSGGNLKRIVPPVLTATERARETERLREETARQARLEEEKRKQRALVARYPDQAAHDKARAEAIAQFDALIAAVHKRQGELDKRRQEIATELEFYQQDPAKAPVWLRRLSEENARQRQSQSAYLAEQQRERQQTWQNFDDELARLRELWKQQGR